MARAEYIFDRFPSFIKEFIYSHSWEALRDVQIAAAETLFESENNLLLTSSTASGKTEAYYPESGKPNVTVTIYVPDESMTIDEYFASCEARYAEALSGYERLSDEERQVAGRRAMSYTYRASYDGVSFRIMQTVLSDGAAMYSVTYTALDDRFDAHFADVETMLDTFTFQ